MSVNKYEKDMNDIFWKRVTKLFGYSNAMKTNNEELTDFFISFENDILLVEDKSRDIEFSIEDGLNIYNITKDSKGYSDLIKGWINFYKSKIMKGVKQLNGAEDYLKGGNKIYKNRNKISDNLIEYNKNAKVHKIILLHNIDEASGKYFDSVYGGPIYSRAITHTNGGFEVNSDVGEEHCIFSYGFFEENIHIISEQQFKFIICYLPTLRDIIDYLNWKEIILYSNVYNIAGMDEYSLVCYYLKYRDSLIQDLDNVKKENIDVVNMMLDFYKDDEIFSFETRDSTFIKYRESANCINNLLHYLEDNKQISNSEYDLKERLMKFYLRLNIEAQLSLTNEIPKILNISYENIFVKTIVLYFENCLYLFSNFDKRIEDVEKGNIYIKAFLSKYVITYLDKFKDKINIDDIVICAMHKKEDGTIRDIYASINIEESLSIIDDLRKIVRDADSILPQKVEDSLNNLIVGINKDKLYLKGRDRNKPCPCGSGKKYKKCCGKYM